jgi:hypothetical protein
MILENFLKISIISKKFSKIFEKIFDPPQFFLLQDTSAYALAEERRVNQGKGIPNAKTIDIQTILKQKKYLLKKVDFFATYISDFFGL